MCAMNTALTLNYKNTCILFSSWRITNIPQLFLGCFAVAGFAYFFEVLRFTIHRWSMHINEDQSIVNDTITNKDRALGSFGHGLQVILGLFLMLVSMTFNVYLILAIFIGAMLGNYYCSVRGNLLYIPHTHH